MTYQAGDLLKDTSVRALPDQPGRYGATLTPAWNILYVFGGVTMATAINAARTALTQRDFELVSATGTFLAPVKPGEVTLDVRSLRHGKGAEQFAVELRESESEHSALHVVTTFGPKRDSDTRALDVAFPRVPLPASIPPHVIKPGSPMLMVPYYHSIETRVVPDAELPPHPENERRTRWLGWHRFKNTPRLPDGGTDPLAYVPACDMIGPALRIARGKQAVPVMVVSLEISLHFFARTSSEWLLQDAQIYHAADGYVSGIVHLWDEQGQLVGHALQRALVRPRVF